MSEYIEIETMATDDPDVRLFITNLPLTDEAYEHYDSLASMEEGSAFAQALSYIPTIASLQIEGSQMIVTRDPETPWHELVADVSAVIKDFFL